MLEAVNRAYSASWSLSEVQAERMARMDLRAASGRVGQACTRAVSSGFSLSKNGPLAGQPLMGFDVSSGGVGGCGESLPVSETGAYANFATPTGGPESAFWPVN